MTGLSELAVSARITPATSKRTRNGFIFLICLSLMINVRPHSIGYLVVRSPRRFSSPGDAAEREIQRLKTLHEWNDWYRKSPAVVSVVCVWPHCQNWTKLRKAKELNIWSRVATNIGN